MSKLTQQQRDELDEEVFEEVKVHVRPFVDREEISNRKANDIYRMVNKEVRRRHFWIRDLVQDGKVRVSFIPTAHNVSDLFTKPLPTRRFIDLRDKAMNVKQRRAA